MSSTTTQWMKIGDFLLRRLKEAGVRHLFGVPGDYNLVLLQQLQDKHPTWGYGYTAALINYAYLAHAVLRTDDMVQAMQRG